MFDAAVEANAFPIPEPSYTDERPLRVYGLGGKYFTMLPSHPHTFEEYDTDFFWVGAHTTFPVPCISFPSPGSSQVIVWAHANHEDVWRGREHLSWMRNELGVHVVGFEYPGYACAPGKATEETTVQSIEAVYRYLRYERGFAPEDIILLGRSIGTAICTKFAATNQVGALILLSPFTSIKGVVKFGRGCGSLGAVGAGLINDMFRSIDAIPKVEAPLLVIHGMEDELVPAYMGQELYEAATMPIKQLAMVPDLNHQDIFSSQFIGKMRKIMLDWLLAHKILRVSNPPGPTTPVGYINHYPPRMVCESGPRPAVFRKFPNTAGSERLSTVSLPADDGSHRYSRGGSSGHLYGVFELPEPSSEPRGNLFSRCCGQIRSQSSAHRPSKPENPDSLEGVQFNRSTGAGLKISEAVSAATYELPQQHTSCDIGDIEVLPAAPESLL